MTQEKKPYLQVNNIYKRFNHIQALNGVSLEANEGEVFAIVGDNGAGKSTLIKILSGVLQPDKGSLTIGRKEYNGLTPKEAIAAGISTVYQDLALGNTMDVASNIFLGKELSRFGFLKKAEMKKEAEKLLKNLEINVPDVTAPVGNLSGGQRQGVAVARLVRNGGKILIFDEPTAAMGLNESASVLKLIRKLADEGYLVIIISHNLQHVFKISDQICIMRQGNVIKQLKTVETTMDEVVSLITGTITF